MDRAIDLTNYSDFNEYNKQDTKKNPNPPCAHELFSIVMVSYQLSYNTTT